MKRSLGLFLAVLILASVTLYGAQWTGYISDAKCGAKGDNDSHKECAIACIKAGEAAVFVTGGKVFTLDNQEEAKKFAGDKVVLQGELSKDGKAIKVSSIAKATK